MPKKTVVSEEFTDASQDANGRGGALPDPVVTGDAHANRPQDNMQGEQGVARVEGQDIPRSQMLAAIIGQLLGMENQDLAAIIAGIGDVKTDNATEPGAAAAPLEGDQGRNLASVKTHAEDVEELFAGEELSEDYKQRATVIFEAAVQARVAAEIIRLEEQAERDVTEAIETVTEEMATQIDKYLTYAAEQFVEEHKAQLADLTRNTVEEQFIANLVAMVEQFKVDSDPTVATKVAELEASVSELQGKLNEAVDTTVSQAAQLKEYEAKKAFDEVAASLSPMQRARFSQLAEGIDFDSAEAFKNRLSVIKESVIKASAPKADAKVLTEENQDGVPEVGKEESVARPAHAPEVMSVMNVLRRL